MADLLWSSYKAAAADCLDSANLNSLADDCWAATNEASDTITEIDNTTNKYMLMDVIIDLASLNIAADDAVVKIMVIPLVDGTNTPHYVVDHSTAGSNKIPASYGVHVAKFNVLNGAQMQSIERIPIGPNKFEVLVGNALGVSFAASGNTVKYRAYTPTS